MADEPIPAPTPLPMTLQYGAEQRLDDAYADRAVAADEARWQRLLKGEELTVGTADENLKSGAKAAEGMAPKDLAGPLESASESVRTRMEQVMAEGPVRKGIDKVLRTFTGSTLEEVEHAVRTGTLPDKLSLQLMDPAGSLVTQMVKEQGEKEGLDPDLTGKIAEGAGLLLGMLFPGKGKAVKKGAESIKGAVKVGEKVAAKEFGAAGAKVDGRVVRKDIPNLSSIRSSLEEYEELPGVREVPLAAFEHKGKPKYLSPAEETRTKRLAKEIEASGEINPLIVVQDKDGLYILEGGHRFDALRELGATSLPALVVKDLESLRGVGSPAAKEIAAATAKAVEKEARVNLLRINASEAVKATIEDLNKLNADRLAGHRAPVSHGTTAKAAEGAITLKEALAHDADTILLDKDKGTALRDLYNAAATHLDVVKRRAEAGDPESEAKLWSAFAVAAKLAELDEANARNIARALNARVIDSESARAVRRFKPEQLAELARKLEGAAHMDAETLGRRLDMLKTPEQQRAFFSQVMTGFRHGRDVFHEAWINALLTNPVTHVANVTGTGLVTLWDLPETAVAGIIHEVFFRGSDGVSRLEAGAKIRGLMEGLGDAFRLAAKTAKTGEEVFATGKVEIEPALSSAAFGWDAATVPGRALDVLGGAVRLPSRALRAEDAFFKGLNYDMEIKALATREGVAEGLWGRRLTRRVTELEAHPTPEMQAAAIDGALIRTLNADLGPAGQAFMNWANQIPGGRVVLPFIRTPTNSAKWFAQRSPVLNMISAQNWSDIAAGGAPRERALARMALGNATGAVIAYEVAQGNITGAGSNDPNLRRLQRDPAVGIGPPYSIKVGETWYAYSRVDPVGNLVGVIADFTELSGKIPDQDALEEWAAHGEAVAIAAGQMMINKTYMQGLSNVLEAIKSPDRSAGKIAEGWARSLVPAGVRQITRQTDDRIVRDARGVVDGFKAGLPWFVHGIPPDRNNITGEAVQYPPGWGPDMVSPIYMTQQGDDPVFTEIFANKISLAPVPRVVGGTRPDEGARTSEPMAKEGIRLTAQERDFWVVQMTQEVTDGRGRTLHQHLSDLVASEQYQRQSKGPEGGRAVLIKAVYQSYRDKGEMVLRDKSTESGEKLERDLRNRLRERIEKKLPVTDIRSPQHPANQPEQGGRSLIERLIPGLGGGR